MALVTQPPELLASARKTTQLAMLVHWIDNPVDAGVLPRIALVSAQPCLYDLKGTGMAMVYAV